MTEYCDSENSCVRCLRNSPIASLIGFIVVLIGGGAFGGATIFAKRYLTTMLDAPHLFPYLDCVVYGLVGAVGLFTMLAYLMCAFSSGWNAKHCFESSRKATCGRCCNMLLLILLVLAVLLWSAVVCVMSYSVMSVAILLHRVDGPARLQLASLKSLTNNGLQAPDLLANAFTTVSIRRNKRWSPIKQVDSEFLATEQEDLKYIGEQPTSMLSQDGKFVDALEPTTDFNTSPLNIQNKDQWSTSSVNRNQSDVTKVTDMSDTIKDLATSIKPGKVMSPLDAVKKFYACDKDTIDLSYYGLYDKNGLPLRTPRNGFKDRSKKLLICVGIATMGALLLILGYLQIIICTAMNYARMQEKRYYEASDAGEEGVALNQ